MTEESRTEIAARNLPIAGRPHGNCVFIHWFYWKDGRPGFGHSIWNSGKLALFDPDNHWLWNHVQISMTDCKGPGEIVRMKQLATYAFGHAVTGLTNRNFAEVIVGVQTMYACQIINGAQHLPIKPNVLARVYSNPPHIIEIIS